VPRVRARAGDASDDGGAAARWNGTSWTVQAIPGEDTETQEVSCAAADSCTAVGQSTSSNLTSFGQLQTLAEGWDGTTWSIPATPDPSTGQNILSGVSCGTSGACTAVGQFQDPGGIQATLAETGD
jgi:hypothetical protein